MDNWGLMGILETARIKNEKLGVTGMLLYKGGNFMQMLEGKKEDVLALFDTILLDRRHYGVVKISACEIEYRNFSNWSMGFKNMDDNEGLPDFGHYVQESLLNRKFQEDSQFAYQFMLTFNEMNR